MAHNKNYTLEEWLEEPLEGETEWKKSWFLNGFLPKYAPWEAYEENGTDYSALERNAYDNILQTYDDGSTYMILLRGCENLDFAICYMELDDDGELVVDTDDVDYICKYSEDDTGWIVNAYDEKLLDKDGDEIEALSEFDHGSDDDLFRVPYTDLDINALANGEIVLTKEAEEKWKKILSGEIPANHNSDAQAKEQDNELTNYFLTLNENGTFREVVLYKNFSGLYIKGDALESLKVLNEKKFRIYIEHSNDFVSDLYQIKPSPEMRLAGFPQGFLLEAGFCDIVSARKKGEDENGNYDADTDILDELLQD